MTNAKEIEDAVKGAVREAVADQEVSKKQRRAELLRFFITPATIAVVGAGASLYITDVQTKNAGTIAQAQRESAARIAEAQLENSTLIAAADREIERLRKIKEVFQGIINPKSRGEAATFLPKYSPSKYMGNHPFHFFLESRNISNRVKTIKRWSRPPNERYKEFCPNRSSIFRT